MNDEEKQILCDQIAQKLYWRRIGIESLDEFLDALTDEERQALYEKLHYKYNTWLPR